VSNHRDWNNALYESAKIILVLFKKKSLIKSFSRSYIKITIFIIHFFRLLHSVAKNAALIQNFNQGQAPSLSEHLLNYLILPLLPCAEIPSYQMDAPKRETTYNEDGAHSSVATDRPQGVDRKRKCIGPGSLTASCRFFVGRPVRPLLKKLAYLLTWCIKF